MPGLSELNDTYGKLVDDEGDIVGQIAFGMFVRARTEQLGKDIAIIDFSLSDSELRVYRASATQEVDQIQEAVLENVQAEIRKDLESEVLGKIDQKLTEVSASTHWAKTIAFNLVAWLISIAITILIARSLSTPAPQEQILKPDSDQAEQPAS